MSTKHTPGPWHKEYDYGAYNIEAPAPGEPEKTFLVACAVSDRDVSIILAAPELLEALHYAEAWISSAPHGDNCFVSDHYEGDPGDRCNCGKDSALEAVQDAIAKATGSAT
jgi:hypothetical protein